MIEGKRYNFSYTGYELNNGIVSAYCRTDKTQINHNLPNPDYFKEDIKINEQPLEEFKVEFPTLYQKIEEMDK